jgi:hypothetical protein
MKNLKIDEYTIEDKPYRDLVIENKKGGE